MKKRKVLEVIIDNDDVITINDDSRSYVTTTFRDK